MKCTIFLFYNISYCFRYTIVFIFYAFALVLMLLIRPWVCRKYLPRQSKMSIYAAMYFLPILSLLQAVIGGLICKYKHINNVSKRTFLLI